MSHPPDQQLVAYFRGTTSREIAEEVNAHLTDCRWCSQLINLLGLISARHDGELKVSPDPGADWPRGSFRQTLSG
jgi:hypothetical protein